ncbi:MAG: hypothetical protein V4614_14860 [Pseudomonadota bacterium]
MNWLAVFWLVFPWVWLAFVVVPPLLLLFYVTGIQYEAGGVCLALVPVVLIGWLLDVLLNWSVFIALTGGDVPSWARREFTLSQRLGRLIARGGRVGRLCLLLALTLNALCIGQNHVRLSE